MRGRPARVRPRTLGAELTIEMMERLRLSQQDFADILGVPRARFRRFLCGDVEIPLKLAVEISDYSEGEVPIRAWVKPPTAKAFRRR